VNVPPQHRAFAETVAASKLQDPRPTFERLSEETGVPVDDLMHHALVRWVSAGSEALLSVEPRVLQELAEARRREDWTAVAGIIDWLQAGT
jgi:N-glycosylase/DNA lyase